MNETLAFVLLDNESPSNNGQVSKAFDKVNYGHVRDILKRTQKDMIKIIKSLNIIIRTDNYEFEMKIGLKQRMHSKPSIIFLSQRSCNKKKLE